MVNLQSIVTIALLLPHLAFAAPWRNLANTGAQLGDLCMRYGMLSDQCMSAVGLPAVRGNWECLAANVEDPKRSYRISWYSSSGTFCVSISEAELPFPWPTGDAFPKIFFARSRVVGCLPESDVNTSISGHYLVRISNNLKDVPEVVDGLTTEATVDISLNSSNGPVSAEAVGIKFQCLSLKRFSNH